MLDLFLSMIKLILSEKLQKRVCTKDRIFYVAGLAAMPPVEYITLSSKVKTFMHQRSRHSCIKRRTHRFTICFSF